MVTLYDFIDSQTKKLEQPGAALENYAVQQESKKLEQSCTA